MTVEVHSPYRKVSNALIELMEKEVIALSHLNQQIARAEIHFREDKNLKKQNKVCEIRLEIIGGGLFVRRESSRFEESAQETLKEIKKLVKKQQKDFNNPPDITTSTVKV